MHPSAAEARGEGSQRTLTLSWWMEGQRSLRSPALREGVGRGKLYGSRLAPARWGPLPSGLRGRLEDVGGATAGHAPVNHGGPTGGVPSDARAFLVNGVWRSLRSPALREGVGRGELYGSRLSPARWGPSPLGPPGQTGGRRWEAAAGRLSEAAIAVRPDATSTTVLWVRGSSDPLPPQAARKILAGSGRRLSSSVSAASLLWLKGRLPLSGEITSPDWCGGNGQRQVFGSRCFT